MNSFVATVIHLFPLVSVVAYGVSAFWFIRLLFSPEAEHEALRARTVLRVGLLTHILFLLLPWVPGVLSVSEAQFLQNSFSTTLSLVSAGVIAVFLFVERKARILALGAFLAPLGLLFMAISGYLFHVGKSTVLYEDIGLALNVHILTSVSANALFVFAFAISVAFLLQESLLKARKFTIIQQRLPSVVALDRLNGQVLNFGFMLMSLGILTGLGFLFVSDVPASIFDMRVLWSVVTFLVYCVLVVGRVSRGWRGRKVAWLSIFGFVTLVASFVGIRIFGESFHVH